MRARVTHGLALSCTSHTIRSLRPELHWSLQVRPKSEPMLPVISQWSGLAGERSYEELSVLSHQFSVRLILTDH